MFTGNIPLISSEQFAANFYKNSYSFLGNSSRISLGNFSRLSPEYSPRIATRVFSKRLSGDSRIRSFPYVSRDILKLRTSTGVLYGNIVENFLEKFLVSFQDKSLENFLHWQFTVVFLQEFYVDI